MRVVDVLRKARALIKRGWTQRTLARDEYNSEVGVHSRHAVCWCADGSLLKATKGLSRKPRSLYRRAYNALAHAMCGLPPAVNDRDDTTQASVLAAFDRAIAKERR